MELVFRLIKKVAYFEIVNSSDDIIKNKMSDLDFMEKNEFHTKSKVLLGEPQTPKLIKFLLKIGLAKNEKQALVILVTSIFTIISLTIFLINVFLIEPPTPDYIEDRFGNRYSNKEYVDLLNKGKDPLSPDFTP
jgi:hypothetical protein